jgi:hypothetical protein
MAGFVTMAVTPNYGWPVPVATDYVKDGYEAIADLGDAIDATVFGLGGGGLALIKTETVGTAVSTVTVTGAFSATYDNYLITYQGGTSSATDAIFMQLGATVTGYYWNIVGNTWSASASNAGGNNASAFSYIGGTSSTNGPNVVVTVQSPFLAKRTVTQSQYVETSGGYTSNGMLNNTTSYTAFTLAPNTGTITGGTIRVYGYKNS